ncbi:hypothetical protein, partial [Saccharopolyspora taberi]
SGGSRHAAFPGRHAPWRRSPRRIRDSALELLLGYVRDATASMFAWQGRTSDDEWRHTVGPVLDEVLDRERSTRSSSVCSECSTASRRWCGGGKRGSKPGIGRERSPSTEHGGSR